MANQIPLEYRLDVKVGDTKDITGRLKTSLRSADKSVEDLRTQIQNVGTDYDKASRLANKAIQQTNALFDKQNVSIEEVEDGIRTLEAAYKKTGSTVQRSLLNKKAVGLQELKKGLGGVSTANKQFQTSTRGSTNTLMNFGRVVQDAPFGIMGVANNIDPLVNSFQNLTRETGSSRGAFKALLGSLTGPAGIALAVSAVTSAAIAFGPAIKEFFTENTKEATEAAQNFNDRLLGLNEELSKLQGLDSFESVRSDLVLVNKQLSPLLDKQERLTELFRIEQTLGTQTPVEITRERLRLAGELAGKEQLINDLKAKQQEIIGKLAIEQRLQSSEAAQGLKADKERAEIINTYRDNIENLPKIELFDVETDGVEAPEFDFNINQDAIQRAKSETEALWQFRLATADEFGRKELQIEARYQKLKNQLAESGQLTKERLNELEIQKEKETTEAKKHLAKTESAFTIQQAQLAADGVIGVGRLLFGESKALSVASAIVDGAAGITKTLAQYGFTPFGIAAAAGMAANTAAQIKTILSTEPGGGGGSAPKVEGGTVSSGRSRTQEGFSETDTVQVADERRSRAQIQVMVNNRVDERGIASLVNRGNSQLSDDAAVIVSD